MNEELVLVTNHRKIIVHIAMSADGYIAREDGDIKWLNARPAPAGFYGIEAFMQTIDTMVLGRMTYEASLRLGAKFDSRQRTIVCSRQPRPKDVPSSVEFTDEPIDVLVNRLRNSQGQDIWLMGGGEIIASFLDVHGIDEFIISVVPIFIGDGIPLIARRHRQVPLLLESTEKFEDGLVQLRYTVLV